LPGENNIRTEAPGMLTSHYAPTAPLIVANIELAIQQYSNKKIGVLSFQKKYETENVIMNLVLSPQGNADEAAKNIFAYLHQLDAQPLDIIIAEFIPNEGLGKAVNDKLKRASAER
jgi:L-threonylcarbamoyladenylate synthase